MLIVEFSGCTTGVIFRKKSSVPMCSSVLPTYSSMKFSVVGFILRSFIHLNLSFVHGAIYGSICFPLHVEIQLYQHHLLNIQQILYFLLLCQKSGVHR